ncbi:putative heat shock protein class I [Aspergillus pseudotamarii]|uniref:Putative heat shock protein class I n=1 Tax=Aspergillus pseudotamarii TaxID=132259 RepID=A0A5N6SFH9_ASPPS|nr:putative heat shock protein class I [Aspergillus pseudotamarii]KAE8131864.1 putative heat shock protein class I [Aspergillus pseudotamarii]
MAFLPNFSSDFAPLFDLLDDYNVRQACRPKPRTTPVRSFTPRFDVYELNNNYHLNGELPGVNQASIDIEFIDPHTLVIKGRVERRYRDSASNTNDQAEVPNDASSVKSLQPTVEDEDEGANDAASAGSSTKSSEQVDVQEQTKPRYKYWITERPIGEFHRAFTFPTRIDQDTVKATLKDGILSVIVPKEPAPTLKKIRVE